MLPVGRGGPPPLLLLLLLPLCMKRPDYPLVAAASKSDDVDSSNCGLYLAPSSTNPDDDGDDGGRRPPKLGLYAGRDYDPGETIGYPEIAIQIFDMDGHTGQSVLSDEESGLTEEENDDDDDDNDDDEDGGGGKAGKKGVKPEHFSYFRFASSFMWTPESTGAQFDTSDGAGGPGQIFTSIPGAGMLGNFHPGIVNAEWDQRSALRRTVQADAESIAAAEGGAAADHPGRGASSEYYNVTVAAMRKIPAGMEIFMNFGADWAKDNADEDEPTEEDYARADKSVDAILAFLDKYDSELTPELSAEIYDFLLKDVTPLGSETAERGRVARSLLPKDHAELRAMRDAGGSLRRRHPSLFRDARWLEEHGQCMDNIRPGPSTVPHAGRGAFAARFIGKGELVGPMPLIHIPRGRREMDMYELAAGVDDSGKEALVRVGGADAEPRGKQLFLNYCFGHPESDMLLYPFGAASNFINHQPGGLANAEIAWSSGGAGKGGARVHRPEWLDVPPSRLADPEHEFVGLAFDVLATRDIRPGEEIFLDYGREWSDAWAEHVRRWDGDRSSSDGGGSSGSRREARTEPNALELNSLYCARGAAPSGGGCGRPFKTAREARRDPYPDRVTTACHISYHEADDGDDASPEERYVDGRKVYQWTDADGPEVWHGSALRLCEVLSRTSTSSASSDDDASTCENAEEGGKATTMYSYTAKVKMDMDSDGTTEVKVVRGIPHEAVRFVDRPYKGDQHREDAFRHWIGIPDHMFPEAWRDRSQ